MIIILELAVAAIVAFAAWRVAGRPAAENLLALAGLVLALAGGLAVSLAARPLAGRQGNPVLGLLLPAAAGSLAFVAIRLLARRLLAAPGRRTRRALEEGLRLPGWGQRLLGVALALLLLFFLALGGALFVRFLAVLPGAPETIRERSLLLRALLLEPPAPPPAGAAGAPAAKLALQRRLLRGLRDGLAEARDLVLEQTGADEVLEQLAALRDLCALAPEELSWLAERNPALQALLAHPAVRELSENQHVLDLVAEAADGSLVAVVAFGDEPAVRRLFADQELRALIRRLDLRDLVRQARARRQAPSPGPTAAPGASGDPARAPGEARSPRQSRGERHCVRPGDL